MEIEDATCFFIKKLPFLVTKLRHLFQNQNILLEKCVPYLTTQYQNNLYAYLDHFCLYVIEFVILDGYQRL